MTLLLSHSQQLLDSQSQAYANLLCWRPSNLFPPLSLSTGREGVRKKHYQNVERGFFLTHPRFVLVRPHSMHRFSVFLTYTLALHPPSQILPPCSFLSTCLSLTLYPSLAHFGLSFHPSLTLSLNLGVSLKFKFKFKQLHWHDKRKSRLGSFSVLAPSQSYAPWPSNLWSGLEYEFCDVEEGQPSLVCWVRSVDSHTMGMSASCSCEGQL